MNDITGIVISAASLLFAVIGAFLIPLIKTKIDMDKLEKIKAWVKIAVQAAEMIYRESGMGKIKKENVLKFLNEKGYSLDAETLDNLIESAVLELKNKLEV